MKAFNVNTRKCEEVEDRLAEGTNIFIGSEEKVFEECRETRRQYLKEGFSDQVSKIQSICWLKDGRILVGFGAA